MAVALALRQANLETETGFHEEFWPSGAIIGRIIPWAVQWLVYLSGGADKIIISSI